MSDPASRTWRRFAWRLILTAAALALWFWTQALISSRTPPAGGFRDSLHDLTAPLNRYLNENARAADALLIVSSALVDALGLYLIASWLWGRSVRPFLGLVLLLGLRQLLQALCALPPPPQMIWREPGFPSLFVTYHVSNDFFFSAHTALAVFAATQLARLRRRWLTILAVVIAIFEICVVIVLRAHYTMDVFAGIVAAFAVAALCERLAPRLDQSFRTGA